MELPAAKNEDAPESVEDIRGSAAQMAMVGSFVILLGVCLYLCRPILLPVAAAIVIGTTLAPLGKAAARHRIPPWLTAGILGLALLAAAKLGYQEYLFRGATRDALIGAYKEHAVQACQKDARTQTLGLGQQGWSIPKTIRLVIGKGSIDVYPWQVDDPMWNARYRNPYLLLTANQRTATVSCEYDITNAAASISRM